MKTVAFLENQYSLLIFLLINIKNKKDIKIYRETDIDKSSKLKIWLFILKIIFKYNTVYGQDHTAIGNKLLLAKNFILLEDGLMNYKEKKDSKLKYYIKRIFLKKAILGQASNVKKIYLTGLAPIPEEIAHKVEIINLKELWNKKTLEEQNEILDIFSFDLNIKEKIKRRNMILFTQPLSEDGIITEKEKIELYSKIIRKYDNEKLVIKKHPREKTDYKEIFNNILVIEESFPAEIFDFLDIKFEKIITIFSTAALNLSQDINIDFYGTEVEDKLLRYFGSFENVMKRNSYL
ncbi:glycosyltransferase family 52 [Fusobacterium ulcerans]|uniref:glycosyltransferase family 52 n=1 Tax=Fusobacterium ulcerans TaxID=861 RepID=UPI001032F7C1|nr:glycosyltransferase family 52 [Fusobacterium ulcerans]